MRSSWWSFSCIAPAHAGPTRLPRQPSHSPDGERHLRRSRSVQRLLCNAYNTSADAPISHGKLSLRSHTLAYGGSTGGYVTDFVLLALFLWAACPRAAENWSRGKLRRAKRLRSK